MLMLASYHRLPFTSSATIAKVAIGVWQTFAATTKQKLVVNGAYYFLHQLRKLELPIPRPKLMLTVPGQLLITDELRRWRPPASFSIVLQQIAFSLYFSTALVLVVKVAFATAMVANVVD